MTTIAYITDIHLDEKFPADKGVSARENWNILLTDVTSRGIKTIIFGGDIGEKDSNPWFFESLKRFKLYLTLGNHDHFSQIVNHYHNPYLRSSVELYYSFEDTHFKYIFLDSSAEQISKTQFKWLRGQLDTTKKLLLFIHHPVFALETAADKQFALQGREEVQHQLRKCRTEVHIFCGHYHISHEQTIGHITQVVTAAASFQLKWSKDTLEVDTSTFGYRLITLNKDIVHSEPLLYKAQQFITDAKTSI